MSIQERDRGGGVKQRFARLRPVPYEGTKLLEHREGGAYPLPVQETEPGMFVSAWMIEAEHCRSFIETMHRENRPFVLSLVVDTNVPGHPAVSLQLQEIGLLKG